jgi:hypothetical protein
VLRPADLLQLGIAGILATGAGAVAIASAVPTTAGPALLLAASPATSDGQVLTVRSGGLGTLRCSLTATWADPDDGATRTVRWDPLDLPDPATWQGRLPAEAVDSGSTLAVMLECAAPTGPLTRSLRLVPSRD